MFRLLFASFEQVNLIQRAVAKDSEGSLREALHLYCMGLQYLLPVLQSE